VMPGDNCSVFGCGSSRRTKGIGIWKLPKATDDAHRKWRETWLGEIKKTRVLDQDFRNQIKNDRVYTCEKHFTPEDIEICKLSMTLRSRLGHVYMVYIYQLFRSHARCLIFFDRLFDLLRSLFLTNFILYLNDDYLPSLCSSH